MAIDKIPVVGLDTGAPYWDSSGNVGIGTSSPGARLEVKGASATAGQLSIHDGTGDTTVSGVTAASLLFQARDSSVRTIAEIDAVNTTTNGTGGAMVFQTRISDTLAERMRIDSSGNLLINTTTARTSSGGLTVETDGTALYIGPKTTGAGNEGGELAFGRGTDKAIAWTQDVLSGASPTIRLINASGVGVQVVNGATAWSAYSDIRLKTNITPLRSVLPDIQSIECINYHLDGIDTDETPIRIGVSAQSLVGKFDEVVDETEVKGKEDLYYSVRYTDMVPVLVKAIQELKAEVDALRAQVEAK